MPTCESCNKTVKDGEEIKHWICEDCRVEPNEMDKESLKENK